MGCAEGLGGLRSASAQVLPRPAFWNACVVLKL